MLRKTLTSFLFLILISSSFAQVVDRAPSKRQNYLAVEGGGVKMNIDTTTSLDSLIGRLSKEWEFIETGKAYWIGYTDDMFSIAARGDSAIQPLLHVLQNSSNKHAKEGAIYCLHLIGIDRTIAGRFIEKFVNPKARIALLQSLKDASLQEDIIRLLIRAPWASDIPYLIETMRSGKTDCWSLVNGLTRYTINNPPIHQEIPDKIQGITVKLKDKNQGFNAQIKQALYLFKNLKKDNIVIEDTLFKSKLVGDFGFLYGGTLSVQEFFMKLDVDDYLSLGSKVQYYVADDKLYICSIETAKRRLIEWWTNLTTDEKAAYNKNSR